MATRTFCDHCGNTVAKPQVFSYGPLRAIREHQDAVQFHYQQQGLSQSHVHGMSGAGGVGGGGAGGPGVASINSLPPPIAAPVGMMINVDLCDHCVPLWMQRVAAITQASDPDDQGDGK